MKSTLCSLLTTSLIAACGPAYHSRSEEVGLAPSSGVVFGQQAHSPLDDRVLGESSTAFPKLSLGKNYIVLIAAYDDVKQLSKAAGFSGHYGHIEVVRNGLVYGCRPPQCDQMNIAELQREFRGVPYEIREIEINGNAEKAVAWFRIYLRGTKYNLFYNNCTDAVVRMYEASGDKTLRVPPVMVDEIYATNEQLRDFMQSHGIPKPKRQMVWFPDQFENLGKLVGRGVF